MSSPLDTLVTTLSFSSSIPEPDVNTASRIVVSTSNAADGSICAWSTAA